MVRPNNSTIGKNQTSPLTRRRRHFYMALVALKRIFCCCIVDDGNDVNQVDESTHLIPSQEEPNVSYSDALLQLQADQRKLRERLGLIVRAKEGKMVNVGSQLPFNLHNQIIPEPEAHDSISRSPSRSDVSGYYYNSNNTDHRYQNHHRNGRRHGRGFSLRSRSASPSHTPSAVITDQPKPNPILNVRWVGFTPKEVTNRGRQRERKSSQSGTPVSEEEGEDAISSPKSVTTLKLQDVGSLSVGWGD